MFSLLLDALPFHYHGRFLEALFECLLALLSLTLCPATKHLLIFADPTLLFSISRSQRCPVSVRPVGPVLSFQLFSQRVYWAALSLACYCWTCYHGWVIYSRGRCGSLFWVGVLIPSYNLPTLIYIWQLSGLFFVGVDSIASLRGP